MKIGLYSITYLGLWYRGEALTLHDLIRTAREFGYDGIEIDGKRPHGNPLDWPKSRCQALRAKADEAGVEILGVAANNDFAYPVPEVREAQICFMRDLIRMTADFGAKHLRVFLSWWGVTRHPQLATYAIAEGLWPVIHARFSQEEIWGWCREALIECARYAGEHGVILALQNHPPLINDHRDLLRMVEEVGSPHLRICLDAPLMKDKSSAAIAEAARAVGPLQVMSHFGGEFERLADGRIKGFERNDGIVEGETRQYYADFARAMRDIGYDGYISYELCHDLPRINGETVGIEFAHANAQLAAEFMRQIVREAATPPREARQFAMS
ncbi:MAG TPA: sugar phosphate isomerase/epimerase family protein [Verrucomicrobiae bacterium]|jgi:sugar phosphate isomerase/epimerase|nr:sugar phosphate isomerase/epimerase family protein [Verrucomicrobiae bacterium]